ncbi:MAG: methyltransferase domain-containing protein [Anaerolineae bacterium]|nr:methyltransferase domain-containing protein [Anaerolineae bacterium]
MSKEFSDRERKSGRATFYESDAVRKLLGDAFHPGGLALTRHLGEIIGLSQGNHVLDVACGRGSSAVHLAERFGCHVTGLEYNARNIVSAHALAEERGVSILTTFRQGDAEGLPFDDETFDAAISECSFCAFPDKARAAAEIARVLRPGGRLGLTDMTTSGPLPEDIQTLLSWVACIAGAGAAESYVETLKGAGFIDFTVEDQRSALLDLVTDIRRKLLGAEIAAGLGKLDLGDADLEEGKRLARQGAELIEKGAVGYTLIVARKR